MIKVTIYENWAIAVNKILTVIRLIIDALVFIGTLMLGGSGTSGITLFFAAIIITLGIDSFLCVIFNLIVNSGTKTEKFSDRDGAINYLQQ